MTLFIGGSKDGEWEAVEEHDGRPPRRFYQCVIRHASIPLHAYAAGDRTPLTAPNTVEIYERHLWMVDGVQEFIYAIYGTTPRQAWEMLLKGYKPGG